jgi:hypothetical protein
MPIKKIAEKINVSPKTIQVSKFPDFKVSPKPKTSPKSFLIPANR